MAELNLTFDQLPQAVTMLTKEVRQLIELLLNSKEQPTTEPTENPLTVQGVADLMSLAVPTIYSKVSRNEIPYYKKGKRLYFSRAEIMDYLKEGRSKSNEEIQADADVFLSNNKKPLNHGK